MADERPPAPVIADFPQPEGLAGGFSAAEEVALAHLNRRVAEGSSLEEILQFLFDNIQSLVPCDRIGLAFLEEEGSRVVAHVAVANYGPLRLPRGYAADLQGSSLERVLRLGRPRVIDDLELYARAHPHSDSTARLLREGIRSSMTCPLMVGGRPFGFLFFSARRPGSYGEREVALEIKIADRLSHAVEKAYRVGEAESSKRAYMELLGFASHELKNPLSSIISEGKVLTGGYLGPLQEPQERLVGKMVRKAEFLLELVRQYLDLARLEEGRLVVKPVTGVNLVDQVIAPAIDIIEPQAAEKGIRIERHLPEAPVLAECDPALLGIVLINLLGNAVKFGKEGGLIQLELKAGSTIRVSIENEGPGFAENQRNLLFRKFSRLSSPELSKRKGTGVGLYTAWWIVNRHGGRIWADSSPGNWARFSFEIPQPLPDMVREPVQPPEGETP